MSTDIIVRFTDSYVQKLGDIKKVVGLMSPKSLIQIIDTLDLDANPRNSRLGSVTDAIQASIRADELSPEQKLFPFKSKGILLASSNYEPLERGRYRLSFTPNDEVEGILDGGHNTLAIGSYILSEAELALGNRPPKKSEVSIWDSFKQTWMNRRADIEDYLSLLREEKAALKEKGISTLDFSIPVELLVPTDPNDALCVENFRTSLLEICDARNNNAQLTQGTKGNQEGLFDSFKALFVEKYPEFAGNISWKTNDGKPIESRKLVALSWIPLSLISSTVTSGDIEAPQPPLVYSGKEKCQEKFLQLMRDDRVTRASGSARRELKNPQVLSALKVATDLPGLYDEIYSRFPKYYNKTGSYGKIGAVKSLKNSRDEYRTPFFKNEAGNPVPEGFIYPLVCGLRALMETDDQGKVYWKTDPHKFLDSPAFENVVAQYSGVIQQSDYDPQKVGKGAMSYTAVENSMKLAVLMG